MFEKIENKWTEDSGDYNDNDSFGGGSFNSE